MRALISVLLFLAAAAPAAAESIDLHDPAALVARARQALREDDLRTACVLLSRAGQLAPHDARIALAWGDYAARQQGLPMGDVGKSGPGPRAGDEVVTPARVGAQSKPIAPEPPAPWPAK
jgi:hypothetical protein